MAKAARPCGWAVLVLSAAALAGCGAAAPGAKTTAGAAAPAFNAAEFGKLAARVSDLERQRAQADQGVAFLKPSDPSFHRISTGMGVLALSVADVSAYANGSRVLLNLGNPMSAVLQGGTARVEWGRVDPSGDPTGQVFSQEATFAADLPGGSWGKVELNLADVPPNELGYVRVADVRFKSISLRAAN